MEWAPFHHPDVSLPVIQRRARDELLTLLSGTAAMVLSGGASELYGHCYPNHRAYDASLGRLRKNGLLAISKKDGSLPALKLTEDGLAMIPDYYNPSRFWNQRWNKWWYVLMFDVPETSRSYRDTLRKFLKKSRFGCLQKSVWVTPFDVRPAYDDLDRGASVDSVAFLFEARTVLGHGNQSVVQEAWDFKRLETIQDFYLHNIEENLTRLSGSDPSRSALIQLLRQDNLAYAQAMSFDPLLPKELHPKNYLGVSVHKQHETLVSAIMEALQSHHV
jgi:DNA-binding transcriptional regulator PaaX